LYGHDPLLLKAWGVVFAYQKLF